MIPAKSQQDIQIPTDVFLNILDLLSTEDLRRVSTVCGLWREFIRSRESLRQRLFLPLLAQQNLVQKTASAPKDIELHPFFSILHFSSHMNTYGFDKDHPVIIAPVLDDMATCPPLPEMRLALLRFHSHIKITNPQGIRVKDVVKAVAQYMQEPTPFTYDDFFGREIRQRRGLVGHQPMTRADMVGNESRVFVNFVLASEDDFLDDGDDDDEDEAGEIPCPIFQARRYLEVDKVRNGDNRAFKWWGSFGFYRYREQKPEWVCGIYA